MKATRRCANGANVSNQFIAHSAFSFTVGTVSMALSSISFSSPANLSIISEYVSP